MANPPDPMAQIEALKPCPFCGGPAEHVHVYAGEEVIGCADRCAVRPCLARETYAWAADDWNRRALAAQPPAPAATSGREEFDKALADFADSLYTFHYTDPTDDEKIDKVLEAVAAKKAEVLRLYDALAAQPGQGEPKGWLCTHRGYPDVIVRSQKRAKAWAVEGFTVEPLYTSATPPTPAHDVHDVKVPDRCSMSGELDQGTRIYNNGWNKCRDAVLRLNKRKPAHDEAGVRAEWQPIETAPKEPSAEKFVIYNAGGRYNGGCGSYWKEPKFEICNAWRLARVDHWEKSHITHWMPLPNPPGYRAALLGGGT